MLQVIKHLISAPCTWIGHCGQPTSTVAVPPCAGSADQSHPEISAGLQKAGSPAAGKCIRHAKETQIVGYSRWAQRQSFAPMKSVFKYRKEDGWICGTLLQIFVSSDIVKSECHHVQVYLAPTCKREQEWIWEHANYLTNYLQISLSLVVQIPPQLEIINSVI